MNRYASQPVNSQLSMTMLNPSPLTPFNTQMSVQDASLFNTTNDQNGYISDPAYYNSSGLLLPTQATASYQITQSQLGNPQSLAELYVNNAAMYKTATFQSANSISSSPTSYITSTFSGGKSDFSHQKQYMPSIYGFSPSVSIPLPMQQQQLLQVAGGFGGVMGVGGKITINQAAAKVITNPKRAKQLEQLQSNKERTIYVSEINHNVTEQDLAHLFSRCGDVVDCRLCGDAHSRMRFAFIEFSTDTYQSAIPEALKLNDTVLCGFPIRVLRSKTAIIPVKREYLPKCQNEMERCQRTIYVSNIDRRLMEKDVIAFFEMLSVDEKTGADGKIAKIRMLADKPHNTSIAFIEFYKAESAIAALNVCQGALMGCLPLRLSPSKTPVRTLEEERAMRNQVAPRI
eukprot:TRINITY_DN5101_c0_g2_i1.p1 TRINITY_DN5101_c0_g2~~TRINITY_DN5101_c0_g2_i1.p1  ORF type:complete len:471 (-),score=29.98 TRINITY_DN5101_c0_g2_i1:1955-3157(-)